MERHDAVIGESEGYPTRCHMNQTRENAARFCTRRAAARGHPCFVVPMTA